MRGLKRDAENPDFIMVHAHDQSVHPPCDWLMLFEYEQRLIATLRENDSRTVIKSEIDADFNPDAIRYYSAADIERFFEFVERKDNIDTYRHKETGELVYHTWRTETADEVFSRAFETLRRLRREPGTPAKSGDDATALAQPIADLHSITHALKLDPGDTIYRNIDGIINDVLKGRRDSPRTLLELMTPRPKKKTLLGKLFGGG